MPPPNIANLQVDPTGLLTWLESNLLMSGTVTNVAPNPPSLAWATITARAPMWPGAPQPVAVNAAGQPMGVFEIKTNTLGAGVVNAVRAYICNYTANNVESVSVGNAGDYCFTINLNGCTYGIGPVQLNGSRLVTHSNRGGNTMAQRADIQAENNVGANLLGVTLLEPAQYRRLGGGGALQATVFGIRTGMLWRFYFQSYTAHGATNFQVHGVFPIPTV